MTTYTPKRRSRGEWITRYTNLRSDFARCIWRNYYTVRYWLKRNWLELLAVAVVTVIVIVCTAAAIGRTAAIYAPNEHVPFLPAIAAVRG